MGNPIQLKHGQTIFYFERGSLHEHEQVKECEVTLLVLGEEGGIYKIKEKTNGYLPLSFEISQNKLNENWENTKLYDLKETIFLTKEEALKQQQKEFEEWKNKLLALSKEELMKKLYQGWIGENERYLSEQKVMKEKIKMEFDVDLK